MRLAVVALVIVLTGMLVVGVGFWSASRPVPSLASDRTLPADSHWYANLPADAAAATGAFLSRIPADMRKQGERYSDTRLAAFLLQQVLALAAAAGISDAEVVTGDASRQTRLLDAHVSGIAGWTRISIDDNTLRSSSDAMLRAVVAHEIGHYVLKHNEIVIITDTAVTALGFAFVALVMRLIVRRRGENWGIASLGDVGGLPAFWGAFLLWGVLSLPLTNAISRAIEHRADLYSLELAREPNGLAEFMIHDADEARLEPWVLEYALFYTHPSDAERVRTAMQWRAMHSDRR